MDFNNDGIQDIISGSYDPGDLYLFRGLGEGKYSAVESIFDKAGLELVHHPQEFAQWKNLSEEERNSNDDDAIRLRVSTFGSWPATVDWDDDGDLDMLIGSFEGDMFLRLNDGTRSKPSFQESAIQVEADGKPLHVNMHAAPVVADWDADGHWDLVVGSGDGAVGWFRNTGTSKKPEFDRYRPLVSPAAESKFFEQNLTDTEEPTHGTRAQICVVDYNNDGMLDLIVGDYSDVNWLRELTEAEKSEQAVLIGKRTKMIATVTKLREQYAEDYKNEEFQEEMQQFSDVYGRLDEKLKSFYKESRRASFVWLFLRQKVKSIESKDAVSESDSVATGSAENQSTMPSKTDQLTLVTSALPVDGAVGEFEVTVDIAIKAGWHLYADVPEGSAHRVTTVDLKLPDGVTFKGDWDRPNGIPAVANPAEMVYAGFVSFSRIVKYSGDKPVPMEVVVAYEVCNKDYCLPVAKLKQVVTVEP